MTATTTTSTWSPSHGHSQSRSSRSSTTPKGHPAAFAGQAMPPLSHPSPSRSPPIKSPRSPSPGYFGFVNNDDSNPPDSNPGQHTKQNWNFQASPRGSYNATPQHQSNETNPAYEAFRKQSESYGFNSSKNFLSLGGTSSHTPLSSFHERVEATPSATFSRKNSTPSSRHAGAEPEAPRPAQENPILNVPRYDSPMQMSPPSRSVADHQFARLSLPASELRSQLEGLKKAQRSDTLPAQRENKEVPMLAPAEIARLLEDSPEDVLLLDLRVYPQYAASRIQGALNLCIPTTLLKRPTFTVSKLAETFTSSNDKGKFAEWNKSSYIIVYDASSSQLKEAVMPLNVLQKFTTSGWRGSGFVIRGGYHAFAKACPSLVDSGSVSSGQGHSTAPASGPSASTATLPVAGGCSMPSSDSAANPFFGNIRQNMDLLDGVGQMPIKKPTGLSEKMEDALPHWLHDVSAKSNEGKIVSDRFLRIEKSEQRRMQKALSGKVSYGTPSRETSSNVQVAGIEKGSKNRYNNIFPFDHTRVKLQGVSRGGCDYVNASFVKASYSNRRYIATQAPIPATFGDFWRVVWEQDVRVIVMLTAESEGGQLKSHPYWNSGEYGHLKLKKLSERQSSLNKSKQNTPPVRPSLGTRRSTQPHTAGEFKVAQEQKDNASESPQVTIRHFTLSHTSHPFQPMREITQLQYTQWPDFGAPASPTAILGLIEQVDKYVRASSSATGGNAPAGAAPEGERPIVVHCSAGCGRTGTFCTIDSVIDMLKQQRMEQRNNDNDMDVDTPDDWITRDDIDLVAKTVDDFRHQRLSMVQNLRQFVLCYESILQWVVSQETETQKPSSDNRGKSFHGLLK